MLHKLIEERRRLQRLREEMGRNGARVDVGEELVSRGRSSKVHGKAMCTPSTQ